MRKIKKSSLPESGRIHRRFDLPEDHLRFSFKYLDIANKKFNVNHTEKKYFETFLNKFKSISGVSIQTFRNGGNSLRSHRIKWEETTEKSGFNNLNQQLQQCEPWQFQLTSNEHGRIHGILIDEVFYVIWLDPGHNLYA